MDILDAALGQTPEEVTTPAEQVADTPQEAQSGPARGPDGKFVSAAQPEPEAPAPTPEPPAPAPQPEAHSAPITALLDEREKRQAAERRAQEIEQQLAQLRQQQQAQPQAAPPSVYEDPEGFAGFMQQQIAQQSLNAKLQISEDLARTKHGDEIVDQARDWTLQRFQTNPAFQQEVLSHRNPYEYAVQAYRKEQAFQKLQGADLDQLLALYAQQQQQAANPLAAPAVMAPAAIPPQPEPPRRSQASAPSAGGVQQVASGPGAAFASVIR